MCSRTGKIHPGARHLDAQQFINFNKVFIFTIAHHAQNRTVSNVKRSLIRVTVSY